MISNVTKWGNSLGVRIPRAMVEQMGIVEGEPIKILIQDNHILIQKTLTLNSLLAQITPENIHSEVDTGPAQGKEIW
jgi:antitoxin MazE